MTRRLSPPAHPVTGNPPVDNSLRSAWCEYRDFLAALSPLYAHHAVYQSAPAYAPAPTRWGHRLPRKTKKSLVRNTLTAAFQYHPADYYTPERILL